MNQSQNNPLTIHEDHSESLHYNYFGLPFYSARDELERYGYEAVCHWHPDLEYIYIVSGTMDYSIDGHKVRLEKGQGIFVNARRLHYGFSMEHHACTFIACVLHPELVGPAGSLTRAWMKKPFGFQSQDYMIFYPHIPAHQPILADIVQLQKMGAEKEARPLQIVAAAAGLLQKTVDLLETRTEQSERSQLSGTFLLMAEFIRRNMDQKLTLEDIARSGAVSRAQCVRIFQAQVRQSPVEFLNNFRLNQAHGMLLNTDLSITAIAMHCGFSSSSYFSRLYHRKYGITPSMERTKETA